MDDRIADCIDQYINFQLSITGSFRKMDVPIRYPVIMLAILKGIEGILVVCAEYGSDPLFE